MNIIYNDVYNYLEASVIIALHNEHFGQSKRHFRYYEFLKHCDDEFPKYIFRRCVYWSITSTDRYVFSIDRVEKNHGHIYFISIKSNAIVACFFVVYKDINIYTLLFMYIFRQ